MVSSFERAEGMNFSSLFFCVIIQAPIKIADRYCEIPNLEKNVVNI